MAAQDWSKPLFMLGATSSAVLTGGITYISILAIPSFLDAPTNTILLTQWRHLINVGTRTARSLALISASCHFLNAYNHWSPVKIDNAADLANSCLHNAGQRPGKLVAAGLATLSIIPFTIFFMQPMNQELKQRREQSFNALGSGDEKSANRLADTGYLTPTGTLTPVGGNEQDRKEFFEREKKGKEETTDLIRRWGRWNLARAVLPLIGTWLAFEAL